MERPKLKLESCPDVNGLCDYIEELEKYCDAIRNDYDLLKLHTNYIKGQNKELRETLKYIRKEIKKVLAPKTKMRER